MFTYFGTLLSWIGQNSLKASLLIALILLAKFILKNSISARWHYFLWFLLIVRLILPWAPESTLSAYNLTKILTPKSQTVESLKTLPENSSPENGANLVSNVKLDIQPQDGSNVPLNNTAILHNGKPHSINFIDLLGSPFSNLPVWILNILFFIWAIGAVILGLYTLFVNRNFISGLKTEPVTSEAIIEIFNRAKTKSNVKSSIPLLMATQIKTPALHGIFQIKLLLPEAILEQIDSEQLYYVFLHELVHFNRKDLWVNGVMNLLVIIHWFNPIIWYGYSKMRIDQELACDESTLSLLGTSLTNAYGLTLIKFLAISSMTPRFAHVTEISSSKSQIRRRLERMKNFRPMSWKLGIVLLVIVVAVATSTLTDAKPKNDAVVDVPATQEAKNIPILNINSVEAIALNNDIVELGKTFPRSLSKELASSDINIASYAYGSYLASRGNNASDAHNIVPVKPIFVKTYQTKSKGYYIVPFIKDQKFINGMVAYVDSDGSISLDKSGSFQSTEAILKVDAQKAIELMKQTRKDDQTPVPRLVGDKAFIEPNQLGSWIGYRQPAWEFRFSDQTSWYVTQSGQVVENNDLSKFETYVPSIKYDPQKVQVQPNKMVRDDWELNVFSVEFYHPPNEVKNTSVAIGYSLKNQEGKDKIFIPEGKIVSVVGSSGKIYPTTIDSNLEFKDLYFTMQYSIPPGAGLGVGLINFVLTTSLTTNEDSIVKIMYQDELGNNFEIPINDKFSQTD